MSSLKPLVVANGQLQQLQSGDTIDATLSDEERMDRLEKAFGELCLHLLGLGFELPQPVIEFVTLTQEQLCR